MISSMVPNLSFQRHVLELKREAGRGFKVIAECRSEGRLRLQDAPWFPCWGSSSQAPASFWCSGAFPTSSIFFPLPVIAPAVGSHIEKVGASGITPPATPAPSQRGDDIQCLPSLEIWHHLTSRKSPSSDAALPVMLVWFRCGLQ